jgi:hypothetical protein
VLVVVWLLDGALFVVWRVAAAAVATVVGIDVVAGRRGSGLERRGWGVSRGAMDRVGSVCRRFRSFWGLFEVEGKVVVAVVNVVDVGDGGRVVVVHGDMAVVTGLGGLISGAVGAEVSLQACEAALQVLGGSVDVPASFSRRGGSSLGSVCVTVSAVEVVLVGSPASSVVCFPLHCL